MSSKAHSERLAKALESTGLAQAVNFAFADSRINVLCRVPAETKPKWLELLRRMLVSTENEQQEVHRWQAHFCQHYFLKEFGESDKRLVYGWNISIQSANMTDSLDVLIPIIRGDAPKSKTVPGEIMEMEMTGVVGERGKPNEKGRGSYTVGGSQDFRPPIRR